MGAMTKLTSTSLQPTLLSSLVIQRLPHPFHVSAKAQSPLIISYLSSIIPVSILCDSLRQPDHPRQPRLSGHPAPSSNRHSIHHTRHLALRYTLRDLWGPPTSSPHYRFSGCGCVRAPVVIGVMLRLGWGGSSARQLTLWVDLAPPGSSSRPQCRPIRLSFPSSTIASVAKICTPPRPSHFALIPTYIDVSTARPASMRRGIPFFSSRTLFVKGSMTPGSTLTMTMSTLASSPIIDVHPA
jgi:hypothetical protein